MADNDNNRVMDRPSQSHRSSSSPSRSSHSSRSPSFGHVKEYMENAMQSGDLDTKSTIGRLPPDEREAILPIREDENPLYGQRQSTEMNDGGGGDGDAGAGKQQRGGMMQAASDAVAKALGKK